MAGNRKIFLGDKRFFKIAQITDLHLSSFRDEGPEQKALALIEEIADAEKPDLFVCTGDLAWRHDCESCIREFCRFMDEKKLYWTFAYGNHERDYGPPTRVIEKYLTDSEYCIFDRGPDNVRGQSNYAVGIYDGDDRLRWILWMLDNCEYMELRGRKVCSYIDSSQIDWFTEEKKRLCTECGDGARSLFFFHIPLPEFREALDAGAAVGNRLEGICCPEINSGAFAAMLEMGDTLGVFVGHDHVNDFSADWHGVKLCYGRVTGFCDHRRGGYPNGEDFTRGARIIVLDRDNFRRIGDTYLYLKGGKIERQERKEDGKA
ncbi:MAG: metallophosphoesterase family protein [Clostridiales bacterium]|nr:metallophosphoesterase family protein [Clostridiales bacterium]